MYAGDAVGDRDDRADVARFGDRLEVLDRKSTRLNSSHLVISYAVFCLIKNINYFTVTICIAVCILSSTIFIFTYSIFFLHLPRRLLSLSAYMSITLYFLCTRPTFTVLI